MKQLPKIILMSVLLVLVLTGCKDTLSTRTELYRWINDPDNGLVRIKNTDRLQITMKYLPPELLVGLDLSHMGNSAPQAIDSLLVSYRSFYTFLLHLDVNGPEGSTGTAEDVMYHGAHSLSDYKTRALDMNFNMSAYVSLKNGDRTVKPVLSNLENTYSLTRGRNLYLVFSKEDLDRPRLQDGKLDIRFQDGLFDTGIHHFVFDPEDLAAVPPITYLN